MKYTTKFLLLMSMAIAAMCLLNSCSHDSAIDVIDGDYRGDSTSIKANNEQVVFPAAMVGTIPADYAAAFQKRFSSLSTTVTGDTKLMIVSSDDLVSKASDANAVIKNNGIVVVINPEKSVLYKWLTDNGLGGNIQPAVDSSAIYAISAFGKIYILDDIPADVSSGVNAFLNPFISWVNGVLGHVEGESDYTSSDVEKLFGSEDIKITHNITLNKVITHIKGASHDRISRESQIDVRYSIYPLYVFNDQPDKGDYYIVNASITAYNGNMYNGNWTQKHGWIRARICGFYLRELSCSSTLQSKSGSDVGAFSSGGLPVPLTSSDQTTYSSGLSWSLSASVCGKEKGTKKLVPDHLPEGWDNDVINDEVPPVPPVPPDPFNPPDPPDPPKYEIESLIKGDLSVGGGLNYKSTETKTIKDFSILNNSSKTTVNYTYKINNLPGYVDPLSISNPPSIAISDATFYQSWIWHVSDTKDNSDNSFILVNKVSAIYGACHFYSSKADFVSEKFSDVFGNGITESVKTSDMPAPLRIPTGRLVINNDVAGMFISRVEIWPKGDTTNYAAFTDRTYAAKESFSRSVRTNSYYVYLKAGTSLDDLHPYVAVDQAGKKKTIVIKRGSPTTLNLSLDFVKLK
jgi:hypothetical protein